MNRGTFALSQKELQRVAVISQFGKGGGGALAQGNGGRPSHRRLPQAVRERIVQLSRGTYAGFNDHHLCEKLVECEGISLSRETLRRLLRQQGLGSPRKRRAPAHRQRRVRSAQLAELVQLDGSLHDWLQGRGPLPTALRMPDHPTRQTPAPPFF